MGTSAGSVQPFRSRMRIPSQKRRGHRTDPTGGDATGALYEGVIELGGGGRIGLWMDPAVSEEAAYRKHWSARRKVSVRISGRRMVIGADDGA